MQWLASLALLLVQQVQLAQSAQAAQESELTPIKIGLEWFLNPVICRSW